MAALNQRINWRIPMISKAWILKQIRFSQSLIKIKIYKQTNQTPTINKICQINKNSKIWN
jgi:hypothetical protein